MRLGDGFNLNQVVSAVMVIAGAYLVFRKSGRTGKRAAKTGG
jgi:hypothetical protein